VNNKSAAFVATDAANVHEAHPEKNVQILGSFPPHFGRFWGSKNLACGFLAVFGSKTAKSFGKSHIFFHIYEIVFHESAFWGLKF
jgi:hypothetical protein